jgi:hypothetical protein
VTCARVARIKYTTLFTTLIVTVVAIHSRNRLARLQIAK